MSKTLKEKPSVVFITDHHHYNKRGLVVDKLPIREVEKQIIVVNTDKHNRVLIVTPDVILDIRSGKRGKKHVTHVSVVPELWDDKTRQTLRLSNFDDMRDLGVYVEGDRIKDRWESWTREE